MVLTSLVVKSCQENREDISSFLNQSDNYRYRKSYKVSLLFSALRSLRPSNSALLFASSCLFSSFLMPSLNAFFWYSIMFSVTSPPMQLGMDAGMEKAYSIRQDTVIGSVQSLSIGLFTGSPQQGRKDYIFQSQHQLVVLDTINSWYSDLRKYVGQGPPKLYVYLEDPLLLLTFKVLQVIKRGRKV